jgi:hypothetical protein
MFQKYKFKLNLLFFPEIFRMIRLLIRRKSEKFSLIPKNIFRDRNLPARFRKKDDPVKEIRSGLVLQFDLTLKILISPVKAELLSPSKNSSR